jgi:hypothetical protein
MIGTALTERFAISIFQRNNRMGGYVAMDWSYGIVAVATISIGLMAIAIRRHNQTSRLPNREVVAWTVLCFQTVSLAALYAYIHFLTHVPAS